MKRVILLLLLSTVYVSFSLIAEPSFWEKTPDTTLITRLLEEMNDQELLGQTLMFGYRGKTPSKEIMSFIREHHIGGIKIFGWNVERLPELVESITQMQTAAGETSHEVPLLIATDQEGGWVRHVKGDTSVTAGNMAIGATNLPYDAYHSGYFIGRELKALGINMNFAPTVDVYVNPDAHVIGPRAFSDDPIKTAELAVAYFHGMKDAGIICTAKHFPGHGNADVDSHGALPIIDTTLEELWDNDLVPYRFLIKEGIPAIMSGHLAYPSITGDETPSSLSHFFQTDLLREKLGFEGILITDDLRMNGVLLTGLSPSEISIACIESGVDIIMMSGTPETQKQIIHDLDQRMKTNQAFNNRVKEAAKRVLTLKVKYIKNNQNRVPLFPDPNAISKLVPTPDGKQFFFELACRSVTIIRDKRIPYIPGEDEKILLAGQYKAFLEIGEKRYPNADTYYFSYSPFYSANPYEKKGLLDKVGAYDTIIFCLANPNSLEILAELKNRHPHVIVFSVLTPIYLQQTPWVDSAIAVYGVGEESFLAGFGVLRGDYQTESELPIRIFAGVD